MYDYILALFISLCMIIITRGVKKRLRDLALKKALHRYPG